MDSLEFEYHAALRGDGFVWRPALAGIDETAATIIADALFVGPPDSLVRVWDRQGAEWHFLALAHSGYRGVRGNAIQLARSERNAAPPPVQPLDLDLEAALLCTLRSAPLGALPLSSVLWSILILEDPQVVRLLELAGRHRPALFVVEAPTTVRERLRSHRQALPIAIEASDLIADIASQALVAWTENPDEDEKWETVRTYLRPQGHEPILRFVTGRWTPQSTALLRELTSLPRPNHSLEAVRKLLHALREAPALLGCQRIEIEAKFITGNQPLFHANGGKIVLELHRPSGLRQLDRVKALLQEVQAGGQLSQAADQEFRRGAAKAAPGTAPWWFSKGVPEHRLHESSEGVVSAAESIRLLAGLAHLPVLEETERQFMIRHLIDGAQAALEDRSTVWGEPLERIAQALHSPPLLMLSALHRGMMQSVTHCAPRLVVSIAADDERTTIFAHWTWPPPGTPDHG